MRPIHLAALTVTAISFSLFLPPPVPRAAAAAASATEHPAKVEAIAGTATRRVTLTEKAFGRLDIKTLSIREDETGRKIAPYTAIFYDLGGVAWVYTHVDPRIFVRQRVVVEHIKGADAFLKEGPPAGTPVVTAGASELYGTEIGVGH